MSSIIQTVETYPGIFWNTAAAGLLVLGFAANAFKTKRITKGEYLKESVRSVMASTVLLSASLGVGTGALIGLPGAGMIKLYCGIRLSKYGSKLKFGDVCGFSKSFQSEIQEKPDTSLMRALRTTGQTLTTTGLTLYGLSFLLGENYYPRPRHDTKDRVQDGESDTYGHKKGLSISEINNLVREECVSNLIKKYFPSDNDERERDLRLQRRVDEGDRFS